MEFKEAVKIIFKHEGFYSDDPDDSGGETKYGISQKAYPDLDIKNLTLSHAEFLYQQDYWMRCKCQGLPKVIRLAVFDCAVNQGVPFASRALQKACGTKQDGVIGPKTIAKCNDANPNELLEKFLKERLYRYLKTKGFEKYGKGWLSRLLSISLKSALNSKG